MDSHEQQSDIPQRPQGQIVAAATAGRRRPARVVVQDRLQERVPNYGRLRADEHRHWAAGGLEPAVGDIPDLEQPPLRVRGPAVGLLLQFDDLLQVAQQVSVAGTVVGLIRQVCPVEGEVDMPKSPI